MRSSLKTAKGLGAASNGVSHWWWQRLTAVALIPMSVWLVASLLHLASNGHHFKEIMNSDFSIFLLAIFLILALFHSNLGIKVIIEDYVHNKTTKFILIILTQLLASFTGVFLLFFSITEYLILIN